MHMLHKNGFELTRTSLKGSSRPDCNGSGGELDRDKEQDKGAIDLDPIPVKSGRELIGVSRQGARCYRLEKTKCGKKGCRCTRGELHGPYWYAYYREEGRMRCEYIGKILPERESLESRARKARKSAEAERERAAKILAEVKDTLKRLARF